MKSFLTKRSSDTLSGPLFSLIVLSTFYCCSGCCNAA